MLLNNLDMEPRRWMFTGHVLWWYKQVLVPSCWLWQWDQELHNLFTFTYCIRPENNDTSFVFELSPFISSYPCHTDYMSVALVAMPDSSKSSSCGKSPSPHFNILVFGRSPTTTLPWHPNAISFTPNDKIQNVWGVSNLGVVMRKQALTCSLCWDYIEGK